MADKITVTLPLDRETPGALVYKTEGLMKNVAVGQVYVRKDYVDTIKGAWPTSITITVELNK